MEAAMETLTNVATFILFASLKGTVLVGLVLVAQKALGRYLSANGHYLLWLAVMISLATPVGFAISLPALPALYASAETVTTEQMPLAHEDIIAPYAETQGFSASPEPYVEGASSRWKSALSLLWLSGVIVVIAAMGFSSRRFAALARKGNPAPENVQLTLHQCKQQAGCKSPILLLTSSDLRAPVVAGLLKPVLLWPAGLEALLTPAQLQHVLMHEVMHVKRRDIFSACVAAILQALHWFNPAIWVAFSWLRQDREMACDAATVRTLQTCHAHEYADTLIQLGALRPRVAPSISGLGVLDSHAQLRRRIHMLARTADPSARHFLTGLLLLAFSALAFSQPATVPRAAVGPEPLALAQAEVLTLAPAPATPVTVIEEAPVVVDEAPAAVVEQEPAAAINNAPASVVKKEPLAAEAEASPARLVIAETRDLAEASAARSVGEPLQDSEMALVRGEMIVASAGITGAAPASILERTVSAAQAAAIPPTTSAPGNASESEMVCRRFSADTGHWHACDSEANWREFATQMQLALENLPAPGHLRSGEMPIGLQDTVCRNQGVPGSRVRNRVCMSGAQWANADLKRTDSSNVNRCTDLLFCLLKMGKHYR